LDVIPAIKKDGYYLVPDRELESWVKTNPDGHSELTTKINIQQEQKFVPFVKMFKHWKKINLNKKSTRKVFGLKFLVQKSLNMIILMLKVSCFPP
jgi:hypothetical protein